MKSRQLLTLLSTILLLIMTGVFRAPFSLGQQPQETSDFSTDVQLGLQHLISNSDLQAQQQKIQGEDYKSTWDEFGVNVLVNGTTPSAEIHKEVIQDIIQSVQTEQNYDRQEENYLQNAQIAPEEVQAVETSVGIDVPPTEYIDANPSLMANPDVNPFSAENTEITGSAELTTSTTEMNASSRTESSTTSTAAEISTSTPEADTSTIIEMSTTDSQIFEAILQGKQDTSSTTPTEPSPENTPPADAAPPADTTPP